MAHHHEDALIAIRPGSSEVLQRNVVEVRVLHGTVCRINCGTGLTKINLGFHYLQNRFGRWNACQAIVNPFGLLARAGGCGADQGDT